MKRRLLNLIWIAILLVSSVFSGCVREEINEGGKLDPEEQVLVDSEEDADDSAWDTSFDAGSLDGSVDEAWDALQEARALMAELKAVEENQLLYTKKEDSDESITLRVTMIDVDSDDVVIGAVGTVKTQGNVIPLEIYYKDGKMVRTSGGNSLSEDATKEQVLATVDFLQSIRRDLKKEELLSAEMMETADGFKTISLVFSGTISGLPTNGRGEILINADGLISSEGYSFEATNKEGKTVSQSVECTLLAHGTDVKPVDLPAELK